MAHNVAWIGDPGCGKTSLILSSTNSFSSSHLPPTLPPTLLTTDETNLILHDTQAQNRELGNLLKSCQLILLVVDASSYDSIENIQDYWLPYFMDNDIRSPIMLALNKMDLLSSEERKRVTKTYSKKALRNTLFEMSVPVSVEIPNTVSDLLFQAQEVLKEVQKYPRAPIIDLYQRNLTEKCQAALRRCFRILDEGHDGLLDYGELAKFNLDVMHEELTQENFSAIISRIRKKSSDYARQSSFGAGITEDGFLCLMQLYAQARNFIAVWNLLRISEFNAELDIEESSFPQISYNIHNDQIYQFSSDAYELLTTIFNTFSVLRHDTQIVSFHNLQQLLAVLPPHLICELSSQEVMCEFEHDHHGLTLDGWLSFWTYSLVENPEKTIQQIVYLDVDNTPVEDRASWIYLSKRKIHDRKASSIDRVVYRGLVFGSPQCGKTWFCNQLPCRDSEQDLTTSFQYYTNRIYGEDDEGDKYKFLTLIEVPNIDEMMLEAFDELCPKIDFVLFLFDVTNPRSFSRMQEIYAAMPKEYCLPVVVFSCKCDCKAVQQFQEGSDRPLDVEQEIHEMGLNQDNAYESYVDIGEEVDPGRFDQLFNSILVSVEEFTEDTRPKIRKKSALQIMSKNSKYIGAGVLTAAIIAGYVIRKR